MTSLNHMQQLAWNEPSDNPLAPTANLQEDSEIQQPGEGLDIPVASDFTTQDYGIELGAVAVAPDNCCYLFDYLDFGGDRKLVCHDGSANEINLANKGFNNKT